MIPTMEFPEYVKMLAEIVHDALKEDVSLGIPARVDLGSIAAAVLFDAHLAVEHNKLNAEDRLLYISVRMAFDFYEVDLDDETLETITSRLQVDLLEFRREMMDTSPSDEPARIPPAKLLN